MNKIKEILSDNAASIIVLWAISSWLTHVIYCLMIKSWGFLIAGALFFPIGIIHGTGVWFGVW